MIMTKKFSTLLREELNLHIKNKAFQNDKILFLSFLNKNRSQLSLSDLQLAKLKLFLFVFRNVFTLHFTKV